MLEDRNACYSTCPEGYGINSTSNICIRCLDNQYLNSQTHQCIYCSQEINGCEQCIKNADGNMICLRCGSGSLINGERCLQCSGNVCSSCISGYYIGADGLSCVKCPAECILCNSETVCTECAQNYVLRDGRCYEHSVYYSPKSEKGGLSAGAICGIAIPLALALLGALLAACCISGKNKARISEQARVSDQVIVSEQARIVEPPPPRIIEPVVPVEPVVPQIRPVGVVREVTEVEEIPRTGGGYVSEIREVEELPRAGGVVREVQEVEEIQPANRVDYVTTEEIHPGAAGYVTEVAEVSHAPAGGVVTEVIQDHPDTEYVGGVANIPRDAADVEQVNYQTHSRLNVND